jgi:hypothetical protein
VNWSDERYVRLYTRDTVTWKRWAWQTRAVMALLLRKVDRAGVLDTGARDKLDAFALLLEVPVEVASAAVVELLQSGTLVESSSGYVLPGFIEAQEAAQSDAARQRQSREKRRAANMRIPEGACHTVSQAVTPCHNLSLQPPVPSVPAVPKGTADALAPPPPKASRSKRPDTSDADPRHQPLVRGLDEVFREVRGTAYPFKPRDFVAVKALLHTGSSVEVLLAAWRRALQHRGYPTVSSPSELHDHLGHFVGARPVDGAPAAWSTAHSTVVSERL